MDRQVGYCDGCFKPVCIEHYDVVRHRNIDPGTTLCSSCGKMYADGLYDSQLCAPL